MKPQRNPRYLAWIRTQPCCVCGSTRAIEASHTGPHGLGQKSADSSAIPLCAKHHRTGTDSYHRLGPRKFPEKHNLDIPSIARRLNMKPKIHVEAGWFVAYLEGRRYPLGEAGRNPAGCTRGPTALPGDSAGADRLQKAFLFSPSRQTLPGCRHPSDDFMKQFRTNTRLTLLPLYHTTDSTWLRIVIT